MTMGGTVTPGLRTTSSPPGVSWAGLPAMRSGSRRSASSVRRPRSRRGTPTASQDAACRSPPTPSPSSTRPPDRYCRVATCFAVQATGRSGTMSTPTPSRIRDVTAAAPASEVRLSSTGTPVPATS